jgi:hypothetical protein
LQKQNNTGYFLKIAITLGLCIATFGSYTLANAMINTHAASLQPMGFPTAIGDWSKVESDFDTVKPDVIAHRFKDKNGYNVDLVLRRNPANAVLHDLTSCLINAQASAKVVGQEKIATKKGLIDASIVEYTLSGEPSVALMWFQAGNQSASDRWSWRALSATSASVRDAPAIYQAELSVKNCADRKSLLTNLERLAVPVFEEIAKY